MEILRDWRRLEVWLSKHAPELLETLNEGARPEQVAAAEAAMSVTLPEEMRVLYRLHDGQKERDGAFLDAGTGRLCVLRGLRGHCEQGRRGVVTHS